MTSLSYISSRNALLNMLDQPRNSSVSRVITPLPRRSSRFDNFNFIEERISSSTRFTDEIDDALARIERRMSNMNTTIETTEVRLHEIIRNNDWLEIHSPRYESCGEDCSICLEEVKDNGEKTNCGHHFHKNCISSWKNMGKHTCPNCREHIH